MTQEELQAFSDLLDSKLEPMQEGLSNIKKSISNLEQGQKKIEIIIENEVQPNIKLIAEGHSDLVKMQKETLEKVNGITNKIDAISNRVLVLEEK